MDTDALHVNQTGDGSMITTGAVKNLNANKAKAQISAHIITHVYCIEQSGITRRNSRHVTTSLIRIQRDPDSGGFPFEVCFLGGCCELCKPAICAPFIPLTWGTS